MGMGMDMGMGMGMDMDMDMVYVWDIWARCRLPTAREGNRRERAYLRYLVRRIART